MAAVPPSELVDPACSTGLRPILPSSSAPPFSLRYLACPYNRAQADFSPIPDRPTCSPCPLVGPAAFPENSAYPAADPSGFVIDTDQALWAPPIPPVWLQPPSPQKHSESLDTLSARRIPDSCSTAPLNCPRFCNRSDRSPKLALLIRQLSVSIIRLAATTVTDLDGPC